MRKLFNIALTVLLCLLLTVLLFTACGDTDSPVTEPPSQQDAPTEPAEPVEPSSPTEPVEPDTPAPEYPDADKNGDPAPEITPDHGPAVLPSGIVVKTDYSQLSKYDAGEEIFTRVSEERVTKLTASDDYGMLYPYVGELLSVSYPYGWDYEMGVYYGLVDAQGRIVVDPVYTSVERVYNYETGESLPIYILRRPNTSLEPESEAFYNTPYLVTLAAMDGSWVCPTEYTQLRYTDGYFIATRDPMRCMIDILDAEGNFIVNSESFEYYPELKPYQTNSMTVTAGMLCFPVGEGYNDWYYADLTGTILYGPFNGANYFSEGLAAVADRESGLYGYINTDGEWVIKPQFMYASSFENGYASVRLTENNASAIIDNEGRTIIAHDDSYFMIEDGVYVCSMGSSNLSLVYDSEFKLIGEYGSAHAAGDWLVTNSPGGNSYAVINLTTGEKLEHEGFAYNLYSDNFGSTDYVILHDDYAEDGSWSWSLLHPELGVILTGVNSSPYVNTDSVTGECYISVYRNVSGAGSTNYDIYDAVGTKLATGIDALYGVTDGMLIVRDGFFSGLYHPERGWHMRVSMLHSMTD